MWALKVRRSASGIPRRWRSGDEQLGSESRTDDVVRAKIEDGASNLFTPRAEDATRYSGTAIKHLEDRAQRKDGRCGGDYLCVHV